MMFFHKAIATWFGIGYVRKGAGTIAAALVCILVRYYAECVNASAWYLISTGALLSVLGSWSAQQCEKIWETDSNRIVVDEVLGMSISLLFLPINNTTVLVGFVLFRVFDIVKPFYIRRLEKIKGGIGVMADDFAAGVYANILLQLLTRTHLI
ncbi:MAG TPA: phosphatidylglycerophosphatase A [Cytophaga sp.]|jgi:phosphatidylglycerophosphatase A|nr:phosphatidylglycerophosphatase A [Cytophaga sp.]